MSMKSMAATGAAGSPYIGVTRTHTRAYTSDKTRPVAPVAPQSDYVDAIDNWISSQCSVAVNQTSGTSELFTDWQGWAELHECFIGTIKRFSEALRERGFARHNTNTRRGFRGIALKSISTTFPNANAHLNPDDPDQTEIRVQAILALDLGSTTGWALRGFDGLITSGTVSFKPSRFDGGGMRYLRFQNWLTEMDRLVGPIATIHYEEVRRHAGTDASHVYGGLMAVLTAWAEMRGVPYQGVPVGTIKQSATGKGNASKAMMIEAARKRGFFPQDDNEADAIAILLWALKTQGGVA